MTRQNRKKATRKLLGRYVSPRDRRCPGYRLCFDHGALFCAHGVVRATMMRPQDFAAMIDGDKHDDGEAYVYKVLNALRRQPKSQLPPAG